MKRLAIGFLVLLNLLSLATAGFAVYLFGHGVVDQHDTPVTVILSFFFGGLVVPLLTVAYLWRVQAVAAGKTLGGVVSELAPVLPWGRRKYDNEGGEG